MRVKRNIFRYSSGLEENSKESTKTVISIDQSNVFSVCGNDKLMVFWEEKVKHLLRLRRKQMGVESQSTHTAWRLYCILYQSTVKLEKA